MTARTFRVADLFCGAGGSTTGAVPVFANHLRAMGPSLTVLIAWALMGEAFAAWAERDEWCERAERAEAAAREAARLMADAAYRSGEAEGRLTVVKDALRAMLVAFPSTKNRRQGEAVIEASAVLAKLDSPDTAGETERRTRG